MESEPLVSIILPLYNKEKWIIATLKSVAEQSYTHWECIIVDDGSTDMSLSLVNDFIRVTPGSWKVINQENSGQSPARNKGIRFASGDYVAFLDSDDLWLPTKLRAQVDFLEGRSDVDALVTGYIIFEEGQQSGMRVVAHRNTKRMIYGWLTMRGFGGLIESTGIVRRETLSRIGGFNETLSTSAGLELSVRLFNESHLETLPVPHVLYRISLDQWHKDTESLKRDLGVLTTLYSTEMKGLPQMAKWHTSYFSWQQASDEGTKGRLRLLIYSTLRFQIRDLSMLYSLSSRNIIAWFKGRRIAVKY